MLLAAAAPAAALEPVTLQLKWKHQFQFAGYYAALEKGYYREAGFDVTLREPDGHEDPVDAVLSGRAAFGIGASELAQHRANGRPVAALAVIIQHSPLVLVARRTAGIEAVRDLRGRRVMILPAETELFAYLAREGIARDDIVQVPHSFDVRALIEGRVDAISGYSTDEPFMLEQAGVPYRRFSPRTSGIDFYGDTLFTSAARAREQRAQVAAFRVASLRGWDYAMNHPEEIVALILAKYGTRHSREHLLYEAAELRELMRLDLVPIGYMNPVRWEQIVRTYRDMGMAAKDSSLDGFLFEPETASLPRWWPLPLAGLLALLAAAAFLAWRFRRARNALATEVAERNAVLARLGDDEQQLRTAISRLEEQIEQTRQLQSKLQELAVRDGLTGLYNRRYLDETLERELARARRDRAPLSLIMLDLDHFKQLNDTHGHQAGDEMLKALASLLTTNVRAEDVVCRYGGEEFVVLLPAMPVEAARDRAEQWREAFEVIKVRCGEITLQGTISLGVAAFPRHGDTAEELTRHCDRALYRAKREGRNRVAVFEPV